MTDERLLDAFGEILYALVRTETGVQSKTKKVIGNILNGYVWGKQVFWSFEYESRQNQPTESAYKHTLDTFSEYGPSEKYDSFFTIMEEVAQRYARTAYQKRIPQKFKEALLNLLKDKLHNKND